MMDYLVWLLLVNWFSIPAGLDSVDYAERERTSEWLSRNAYWTWRGCERLSLDSSPSVSPEVRVRAASVVTDYCDVGRCRRLSELLGLRETWVLWNPDIDEWQETSEPGGDRMLRIKFTATADGGVSVEWKRELVRRYVLPIADEASLRRSKETSITPLFVLRPVPYDPTYQIVWLHDDELRLATHRLARDLLRMGLPRGLVRRTLCER